MKINKEKLYYALWFLCGILMGILVSGVVTFGLILTFNRNFNDTLLALIFFVGATAGLLFGYWAGPIAWRKIYIEGLRGKKYVIKKG